jgi:hypothetical protein
MDEHDKRILAEVHSGEVTYKGSVTSLPGLPDTQVDVGGWEAYPTEQRAADYDTDADGVPDAWEKSHALNPADAADGQSKLELYLNELVGEAW